MSKRVELFNQDPHIQQVHLLAEAIAAAETEFETSLPQSFKFGALEFDNGIRLARAGDFYFLSPGPTKPFLFFDSLTSIQLYITDLYNQANKEGEMDPSWKAFWSKELSKL